MPPESRDDQSKPIMLRFVLTEQGLFNDPRMRLLRWPERNPEDGLGLKSL